MRLTGFDFFPDSDRAAVSAWDGSIWLVTGLTSLQKENMLTWRRIASGLFQPLGVKIVDGQSYVTCRDQICILHDLNGDGEDDQGNFYYANYGSKHYDERSLKVASARLSADRKKVFLEIPDIQPTWSMEIKYSVKTPAGKIVNGAIHNTIHHLGE